MDHLPLLALALYIVLYASSGHAADTPDLPTSAEEAIKDYISRGKYHSHKPPSDTHATEVKIGLYVNSFRSIDSKEMSYSMSFYLRQQWTDQRLAYNNTGSRYTGITQRVASSNMERVWLPDLFFRNEIGSRWHDVTVSNKLMKIKPNGQVWYVVKLSATLSCPMNLQSYPFDTQMCPIMFESFGYTMDVLYFSWLDDPVEVDPAVQQPQFTLRDKILFDCSQNYTAGAFPCLSTKFVLSRDVGYYASQVFFPSVLLVALSWLAFWLGRDAPTARVLVGLLVMTSLTMVSNSSNESLPTVSYTKAIDIWFAVCFLFVFAVLLEVAVVEFFRQRREAGESGNEKRGLSGVAEIGSKVDVVCRVVFPVAFLLFFIIYFAVHAA